MGLKFGGSFDHNMNMMKEFDSLIGSLCNFFNRLEIYETEGLLGYYYDN